MQSEIQDFKNESITDLAKKQSARSNAEVDTHNISDAELVNRYKRKATLLEERQEELKNLLKDEAYCKKVNDKDSAEYKKVIKLLNTITKTKAELRERRQELPINPEYKKMFER